MTSCIQEIAKGIAMDCNQALVAGYTGRAVYIPYDATPTLVKDSGNPRILSAVTSSKVVGIDNAYINPFAGSTVTGNGDNGRVMYTKSLSLLIPSHGADEAKSLIEPLMKNAQGGVVIVERKDKRGLGSYVVLGLYDPVKADPASFTRDEAANGGAAALTLTCTEDYEECNFFDTDYATTKAAFDALFTAAV